MMDARREVRADKNALGADLAAAVVQVLDEATEGGHVAHVNLTGGSMGTALMEHLPAAANHVDLPWDRVHVWWSDERFVAADSDERNDKPAIPVLCRVGIPENNLHRVATTADADTLDAAAEGYAKALANFAEEVTNGVSETIPVPAFDITLLGVGPDGHVASLFPHNPAQNLTGSAAIPVPDSPKPPPERVSMTFTAINSSRRIWFTVAGADKAEAVARAVSGDTNPWECPASAVSGQLETVWWLDEDAAAQLG